MKPSLLALLLSRIVVPPTPSPSTPVSTYGAYRSTQQWLFADITPGVVPLEQVSGYMTVPPRAGISSPADGFIVGVYGPTAVSVENMNKWAWANTGGDWINTVGTPQATSLPHFTFAANNVTSGSAAYTANITAGVQAAQTADRWNAYIVKCVGGTRAIASRHHATLPAPSIAVTYVGGATATLACVACTRLTTGTLYTQTGQPEAIISQSVALEFERPTGPVSSATLSLTITQHSASTATISGYLANPPADAGVVVQGLAASYVGDAGIGAAPGVLASLRFPDGGSINDWLLPGTVPVFNRNEWNPAVLGLGANDDTKLPTAYAGTPLAGKWFRYQVTPNVTQVDSSYSGDGFVPLTQGSGALRVVTPGSTAADGATEGGAGSLGADIGMLFPEPICGTEALKKTFVRFYVRFAPSAKRLADTKMYRVASGAVADYAVQAGKTGFGVDHRTSRGGNNRTGGHGLGWSNRLSYVVAPSDFPISGTILSTHSLDMFDDRTNIDWTGPAGGALYPNRWYCIETELDLNTMNLAGGSPSDGVLRVWIDGHLVVERTGWQYRDGPLDPPGTGNDLPPFRTLGPRGIWLNDYNGGVWAPDADRITFYDGVVCSTSYIGPMLLPNDAPPEWTPAPLQAKSIGYNTGAHPVPGKLATLWDARPANQSWNVPGDSFHASGDGGIWATGHAARGPFVWDAYMSFCGRAWDEERQIAYYIGGGHQCPCIGMPLAWHSRTLEYKWEGVPLPSDGFALTNNVPANAALVSTLYPADQYDTVHGEWIGGYSGWPAGTAQPGNRMPEAAHTYAFMSHIPGEDWGNTNGVIIYPLFPQGNSQGSDIVGNHYWDLDHTGNDAGGWHRIATPRLGPAGTVAGGAGYHRGVKRYFLIAAGSTTITADIEVLDPATQTWTLRTATNTIYQGTDGYPLAAYYDQKAPHGILMAFMGIGADGSPISADSGVAKPQSIRFYACSAQSAIAGGHTWTTLNVTPPPDWPRRQVDDGVYGPTPCFVPNRRKFYQIDGRNGSTSLWELVPPSTASATTEAEAIALLLTGAWTYNMHTLTSPLAVQAQSTPGAWFQEGKLVYNPAADCLHFIGEGPHSREQAIGLPPL